jgi:hypothetical protein
MSAEMEKAVADAAAAAAKADEDAARKVARIQVETQEAVAWEALEKDINTLSDNDFRRFCVKKYGFFPGV